jgi:surface protein
MPLQYAANATVDISVQAVEISLNMSPSSADTTVHIVSEEETVILPVYGSDSAPITTGNLNVITTLEFEDTDHVIQPPVDGYKTVKIDPLPSTEEESFTLDLLPVQLVPFIFEVQTDNLVYHDYDYYIFTDNQYVQRTTDPNHATLSLQGNGLRLTEITWLPSATPSPGAAVISSPADSYTLPTVDGGVYNCTVEWGDGTTSTITSWNQSEVTHQYPSAGKYRIKISGQFEGINFHRHEELNHHDHLKLLDVISWGDDSKMDIAGHVSPFNPHGVTSDGSGGFMTSSVGMFCGCKNWNDVSGGAPNWGTCGTAKTLHPDGDGRKFGSSALITVFYGNSSLQADISVWTTEDRPFTGNAYRHFETRPRVSDIDTFKANFHWLVSNGNNWKMFTNRGVVSAEGNSLLRSNRNSRFEVSNWKLDPAAPNIAWQTTFNGNNNMDPDVSNLVGPNVSTVAYIFNGADSFTGRGLENWDISGIDTNSSNSSGFTSAFAGTAINKILPWTFAFGARLTNMLFKCKLYDSPCNGWDTSGVYQASGVFHEASNFNNGGVSWTDADWTNCQTFGSMFRKTLFNQDVSRWKLSTTRDFSMKSMFMQTPFNRPVNTTVVDEVKYWDMSRCTNTSQMFYNSGSFNQPLDAWDMSNVTDISSMFYNAIQFNQPLNTWNTGNVTNMSSVFYAGNDTHNFNQPLSNWDTSKVTQMQQLFRACRSFNHPLVTDGNKWDVSKVTNMSGMFYLCKDFNQDLSSWDVSSVENFNSMFRDADSFNQDLSSWNTSSATSMQEMFSSNGSFNGNVSNWDVSNVTSLNNTFIQASSFTGQGLSTWRPSSALTQMVQTFYSTTSLAVDTDLGAWDVSGVTTFDRCFYNSNLSGVNLNNWNVSSAEDVSLMFGSADNFNTDISGWDVSNVKNMKGMFKGADSFNQDLSSWNLSSLVQNVDVYEIPYGDSTRDNFDYHGITTLADGTDGIYSGIANIFQDSGMSKANLDATISGWCDSTNMPNGSTIPGGHLQLGRIPLNNSSESQRLDASTIDKMQNKNMTAKYSDGNFVY